MPASQEPENNRKIDGEVKEIIDRSLAVASGALVLAQAFHGKLESLGINKVLTGEDLEEFAGRYPQWTVSSGITNGEATKVYQRVITSKELPRDRREGGLRQHDTYLSLADPEHSDMGLAQVFGDSVFDGEYVNKMHYVISFCSTANGPVDFGDVRRVADAERYLVENEYLLPAAEKPAA